MINSILIGVLASVLVVIPGLLRSLFSLDALLSPFLFLAVGVFAAGIYLYYFKKPGERVYDGVPDFIIHIHSPAEPDYPAQWNFRGLISFFLHLFGAPVGPEGPAAELSYAGTLKSRSRSGRWFEQRRRSDAAAAIVGGISAVFGAPFAAILLVTEIGIGGRLLSSVLTAVAALSGVRLLTVLFSETQIGSPELILPLYLADLEAFINFSRYGAFTAGADRSWLEYAASFGWILLGAIVVGFFLSLIVIFLIQFMKDGFSRLVSAGVWKKVLIAATLLLLIAFAHREAYLPSSLLLRHMVEGSFATPELLLMAASHLLAIVIVLAGFGTAGIFLPLFVLGSIAGMALGTPFLTDENLLILMAFAAAAALLSGTLSAPFAASVLGFELTGRLEVLLLSLASALIVNALRKHLGIGSLLERDLTSRDLTLLDGRSAAVMNSIPVSEAMVTDHQSVSHRESLAELKQRLQKSRYPFLPVVDSEHKYRGMLTADMIEESLEQALGGPSGSEAAAHHPLPDLLEAKDLLYRSGGGAIAGKKGELPVVKMSEPLSASTQYLRSEPCIAVIDSEGRVAGLLFAYSVRLAYEREIARRALYSGPVWPFSR